jgi:predicted PurR-regulated permease PerM
MVKFTIQSLLVAVIFLVGVLLGMQQVNESMRKMKGYDDPSLERVIHVSKDETIVLGQSLEQKKEKLQQIETFNVFSKVGQQLATFVHSLVEHMLSFTQKAG